MTRHFPFTPQERSTVVAALYVAIVILEQRGQDALALRKLTEEVQRDCSLDTDEVSRNYDSLSVEAARELGDNVVSLDKFRKITISHQAEIDGVLCHITGRAHDFQAYDRHGDRMICEHCGYEPESEVS